MRHNPHLLSGIAIVALLCGTSNQTSLGQDASANPAPFGGDPNSSGNPLGGGFGGKFTPGENRFVQTDDMMIAWSEGNDELRGFSQKTGEWTNLPIKPQKEVVPVIGEAVGAVRVGDTFAAYSSEKGTWSVLPLTKDSEAQPVVHSRMVQVNDGGHLYTFAAANGRWTSPSNPEFQQDVQTFSFDSRAAMTAAMKLRKWADALRPHELHGTISFSRNRMEVTAYRRSWLKTVREKFEEFQAEAADSKKGTNHFDDPRPVSHAPKALADVWPTATSPKRSALEQSLTNLEQRVISLTSTLRTKKDVSDEDRQQLRKLVDELFEARQRKETAHLDTLKEKVNAISKNLQTRSQHQQRIVERRVEELLDPAVKWEAPASPRDPGIPLGSPLGSPAGFNSTGRLTTGTPIGLPGPPHLPFGSNAGGGMTQNPARTASPGPAVAGAGPGRLANSPFNGHQVADEAAISKRLNEWHEKAMPTLRNLDLFRGALTELKDSKKHGNEVDRDIKDHESEMQKQAARLKLIMPGWKQAWRAYQTAVEHTQLRVREYEVQLEAAAIRLERLSDQAKRGYTNIAEVDAEKRDLELLKLQLARAKSELDLLTAIAEDSPHLNPASVEPLDKTEAP